MDICLQDFGDASLPIEVGNQAYKHTENCKPGWICRSFWSGVLGS